MNATDPVSKIYQQIKLSLNNKLEHLGYQPVHEEMQDAVFGNRYMLWSNNTEAMRFCWDGRERRFALEITEDLPLRPLTRWEEILIVPFKPTIYTAILAEETINRFLKSLD